MTQVTDLPTHHVKVRGPGMKAWSFLSGGGCTNRLRIHAVQMTEERARLAAEAIAADNPGWQAKPVSIS